MCGREREICPGMRLLDQEAPPPKFSSENDWFPLFKKNGYCGFSAREIIVPLPLWSFKCGGKVHISIQCRERGLGDTGVKCFPWLRQEVTELEIDLRTNCVTVSTQIPCLWLPSSLHKLSSYHCNTS